MNILGITGLGVAPAACLVQNGKLVAMAEEERFNRIKGSFGLMPEKAALFCLNYGQISLDNIDFIAFPWDASRYKLYMPYFFLRTYLSRANKFQKNNGSRAMEELLKYRPENLKESIRIMLRSAGINGKIPPIRFIPHHLAHAASAFYCSGFDSSYILVIDGSGEDKCTTIFKGNGLEIREKKSFKIPDSLGWFYQSITEFLGFRPNSEEGKTMALAAYGRHNDEVYSKLKKMISFDGNGGYRYDANYSFLGGHSSGMIYSEKMVKLLKYARRPDEPIQQIHKDIAFAAQDILEKIAVSLVKDISRNHDFNKKLCLAGGVCLNCKMNGIIAQQEYIEEIFIPPVTNDSGAALGAALYLAKENGLNPKFRMEHPYWGPVFSNDEIKRLLNKYGLKFKEDPSIEITTAKLLSQDKTIGWFQNRMEIGPRALGARSILANPAKEWMQNKVNEVKNREPWRPFAPSVLHEAKDDYILRPKESPFMTLGFKVPEEARNKIPAVVHLDNTMRPQLVKKDINARYWKLIKEFEKNFGLPVILNTSFNNNQEPIVCTPEQSLRTFYISNLDYLVLNNFLVHK